MKPIIFFVNNVKYLNRVWQGFWCFFLLLICVAQSRTGHSQREKKLALVTSRSLGAAGLLQEDLQCCFKELISPRLYQQLCSPASSVQHPGCGAILQESSAGSAQRCGHISHLGVGSLLVFLRLLSLCVAQDAGSEIEQVSILLLYFSHRTSWLPEAFRERNGL